MAISSLYLAIYVLRHQTRLANRIALFANNCEAVFEHFEISGNLRIFRASPVAKVNLIIIFTKLFLQSILRRQFLNGSIGGTL